MQRFCPRNKRRFSTSDVEMEGREDRTQIQQIYEERIVNSGQSKTTLGKNSWTVNERDEKERKREEKRDVLIFLMGDNIFMDRQWRRHRCDYYKQSRRSTKFEKLQTNYCACLQSIHIIECSMR